MGSGELLLEIFGLRVALPVSLDQGRQPVLPVPELYRQLFDARVALRDLLLEVLLRVVVAQLVALRDSRFEVAANVFELPLQLIASVNLPLGIAQGWLQPRMASPTTTPRYSRMLRPSTEGVVVTIMVLSPQGFILSLSSGPALSGQRDFRKFPKRSSHR